MIEMVPPLYRLLVVAAGCMSLGLAIVIMVEMQRARHENFRGAAWAALGYLCGSLIILWNVPLWPQDTTLYGRLTLSLCFFGFTDVYLWRIYRMRVPTYRQMARLERRLRALEEQR